MTLEPESVMITDAAGTQLWYVTGRLHRTDGPALIWANGTQLWYVTGRLHRTDGPAVIWANGHQEWWVRGQNLTKEIISWMQQRDIKWPWSESAQVEFVLTWS